MRATILINLLFLATHYIVLFPFSVKNYQSFQFDPKIKKIIRPPGIGLKLLISLIMYARDALTINSQFVSSSVIKNIFLQIISKFYNHKAR